MEILKRKKTVRKQFFINISRGNHCDVCGLVFAEGENICGNGHEVGGTYLMSPMIVKKVKLKIKK
jgi:hypothetical protein